MLAGTGERTQANAARRDIVTQQHVCFVEIECRAIEQSSEERRRRQDEGISQYNFARKVPKEHSQS